MSIDYSTLGLPFALHVPLLLFNRSIVQSLARFPTADAVLALAKRAAADFLDQQTTLCPPASTQPSIDAIIACESASHACDMGLFVFNDSVFSPDQKKVENAAHVDYLGHSRYISVF